LPFKADVVRDFDQIRARFPDPQICQFSLERTLFLMPYLPTRQDEEPPRKGIHLLIPVVLGILSSGLYAYSQGQGWVTALAIGLGSGGAASTARNVDKTLIGIAEMITALIAKNKAQL
jgi:hypothetical protein